MKRRLLYLTTVAVLVAVAVFIRWHMFGAKVEVLRAGPHASWYRGNLHTHSHWSDGDDYLEMIALWYRDHGYHFLVFTDHNVLATTERWINVEESKGGLGAFEKLKLAFPDSVNSRVTEAGEQEVRLRTFDEVSGQLNDPGKFLLVQGEEISDAFDRLPIHINVANIAELIQPTTGDSIYDTIQNNVRAVAAQRERTGQTMMVHVNHPNFGYAITAEDLMRIHGDRFFEVYNGHPDVANLGDEIHAGTERVWDIVLTRRLAEFRLPVMYGLAVDDAHHYHGIPSRNSMPGRGWVTVLANQLSADSMIEAMEAGRFYSSSGVTLRSVAASTEGLAVEVDPVEGETYVIQFIGTRTEYDADSHPVTDNEGNEIRATRIYSRDIGETFKTVHGNRGTYHFAGDEIYVRARITSSAAHPNPAELGESKQAWCQPVIGPGVREE